MTSPIQRSFSAGEISPQLYGHVDQQKYATGLRTCRNMPVMRHGGVVSRPGLQYISELPETPFKIIPFIFNAKVGQTFLIIINGTKISFIQNGGQVVEGAKVITGATNANPGIITSIAHGYATGDEVVISSVAGMTQLNGRNFIITVIDANHFSLQAVQVAHANIDTTTFGVYISGGSVNRVYKIASPWNGWDHSLIQYAQTGDVITIVHPFVSPYELQRISALNWQLTLIPFKAPVNPPTGAAIAGGTGTAGIHSWYKVTAVNANGDETELSFAAGAGQDNRAASASVPIVVVWNPSSDAAFYRVYKSIVSGGVGVYGFIGTAALSTPFPTFSDYGATPDFLNTPPILSSLYPFGNLDYPSTVGFVQQRRVFANSIKNPTTIWMSRTGSFSNFSYHNIGPQPDDDPITFIPANEQVNSIEHVLELRQMLALTSGAELAVQGNNSGTVTPSAVNPQAQSFFGSGILKPITFGDVCLFQQARGWFVHDLGYAFEVNGYRGNDLTIFSSHLFEGFTLKNWTYQQIPNSIAWMARSDGKFLGLTYVREQQILAWHRHDTTNGAVLDTATIPESPEDGVYFIVQRTINNLVHYYIERMANFHWDDITNLPLMDSWLKFTALTNVLSLGGGTTWDYDDPSITMALSAGPQPNVGDQVWTNSPATGQQIRFTVTAILGFANYSVRPNRIVPIDLRDPAKFFNCQLPIQTVTNLWTLEGQTVSVFADGFVVGSPNNSQIKTKYVVTNGQITLDKPYASIFVGLPITYDIETLDVDTAIGDSILDTKKDISRVAAYVINTRGIFAGQRNPDTDPLNTSGDPLFGLMEKKPNVIMTYDSVWPLETKPIYINIEANWNRNGRIFIRQVDPLPMQIVSIVPEGLVATKSQYLRV